MKSRTLVCLLAAGSLGFGSLSFAQGNRDHDRNDGQRRDQRDERHDDRRDDRRDDRHDRRDNHEGRHDARDFGRSHNHQDVYYYGARGPEWHRGGRLPTTYRDRQYVVSDWRGHNLNAPPRGYQWVQVGNDYVLAAIATGIIAQLLLRN